MRNKIRKMLSLSVVLAILSMTFHAAQQATMTARMVTGLSLYPMIPRKTTIRLIPVMRCF